MKVLLKALISLIFLCSIAACDRWPIKPQSAPESLPKNPVQASEPAAESPTVRAEDDTDRTGRILSSEEEERLGFSVWMSSYMDAARMSRSGRRVALRALREVNTTGQREARILYATFLASSPRSSNWNKAQKLLESVAPEPDERSYVEWLLHDLAEKLALEEDLVQLRNQLAAEDRRNAELQMQIRDLQEKIEALTAIEHTIIEKQIDALE